ncbi:unnamed protein product [Adineta steineri]|uniref:Methyltransferase domain-containing protein n=1 Tax=Adineta steineri TaxID=433720 RepID=A0A818SZT5_9BILA|nr:unnamed protein product [Adineta steineri]
MDPNSFSLETHQQAAVFDQIGDQYETVYGRNTEQIAAMEWLLQRLPSTSHVLDIGSGTGVPTARMLAGAGHDVTGVDISAEMIRIAKQQVPQATFLQADANNLTFDPASFHAITAFFSLLMMRRTNIESTLQRLKTFLQTPGYLVLSMIEGDFDYQEIPFLGQSIHVTAYPREIITRLLKDLSFTILDSRIVTLHQNEERPPETQLFFFCQYQP